MQDFVPIGFGFLITVIIIFILNPLSHRIGWVDKPDALRKLHSAATPLTGGVAMIAALLATNYISYKYFQFEIQVWILAGISIMCLIGLWDDKNHLSARFRLFLQSVISFFLVISADFSMSNLGNIFGYGPVILNSGISKVFTVFCIVGAINAINMIDGIDGLAGGVTLTALLSMLYLSNPSNSAEANILLALTGCIIGYLCFNLRTPFRKKAAIFMGDAGSTSLGVAIAWLLISHSQPYTSDTQSLFPPIIALWLVSVPLLDTISLIISRVMKGKSPFKADRDHFHHILVDSGFSDGQTTIIIILISAIISGLGVMMWKLGLSESNLLWIFLIIGAIYFYTIHYSEKLSKLLILLKKKNFI